VKLARQFRRMEARTRARSAITTINMVSLLDIFTILLLFLLVQAGDPDEVLPVLNNLKLPYSSAELAPKRDLVVGIDQTTITVDGRPVATVAQVAALKGNAIPELSQALKSYFSEAVRGRAEGDRFAGRVTVMGDEGTPFVVLKKVMHTCAAEHFGHISLAVQRLQEKAG